MTHTFSVQAEAWLAGLEARKRKPVSPATLSTYRAHVNRLLPLVGADTLLADVNNEARHPALAIGGVTACGYLGMVAGPPLVGLVSSAFGLRTGLMVLAAIAMFVALTPAHVRARSGPRAPVD